MTLAERELLLILARDLVVSAQSQATILDLIAAIETETLPLPPRAKYVEVVRREERADKIAARYHANPKMGGEQHDIMHNRLLALGQSTDMDAIDEVIGNRSWTQDMCDGCSTYVRSSVKIGEYETQQYCFTCIAEAAQLIEAVKEDNHGNR